MCEIQGFESFPSLSNGFMTMSSFLLGTFLVTAIWPREETAGEFWWLLGYIIFYSIMWSVYTKQSSLVHFFLQWL